MEKYKPEKPPIKLTEEDIKTAFRMLKSYQAKTELLELIISANRKIKFGERLFWVLVGSIIMFLCRGYYV